MTLIWETIVSNSPKRVFVCGTRAVVEKSSHDYRVVCATCDGGGTVPSHTKSAASAAAVRDSNKACRKCGAS
jgi:hypothetical protein